MMKARILDVTWVYPATEADSEPAMSLQPNDEVELGDTVKVNDQEWVPVTVDGVQKGYVRGDTKVFMIRSARLNQKGAELMSAPGSGGTIVSLLARGARVEILDIVQQPEGRWVRVRDDEGHVGYIPGQSKLGVDRPPVKQDMNRELQGWGVGLVIMGGLSIALSQYLNAMWGIALVVLGIAVLIVRRRVMYLAIGAALLAAGGLNLATRGLSPWALFAALQVLWGIQLGRKFWTYASTEEEKAQAQP